MSKYYIRLEPPAPSVMVDTGKDPYGKRVMTNTRALPKVVGICPECYWWVNIEAHEKCPECDAALVRFIRFVRL